MLHRRNPLLSGLFSLLVLLPLPGVEGGAATGAETSNTKTVYRWLESCFVRHFGMETCSCSKLISSTVSIVLLLVRCHCHRGRDTLKAPDNPLRDRVSS